METEIPGSLLEVLAGTEIIQGVVCVGGWGGGERGGVTVPEVPGHRAKGGHCTSSASSSTKVRLGMKVSVCARARFI